MAFFQIRDRDAKVFDLLAASSTFFDAKSKNNAEIFVLLKKKDT